MVQVYESNDVNKLFPELVAEISQQPLYQSRNGPVLRFEEPVVIAHKDPRRRVLLSKTRDVNPFFHFFEALWMMNGQNDLGFVIRFNPRMADYSDDGKLVRGSAYGIRWRSWFKQDQLLTILAMLNKDPLDRRAVLTIWDGKKDLGLDSKDVPCNTHCYFSVRKTLDGKTILDLTVSNRSNDLIYGCLGSNVFHFGFLLELMAGLLGFEVGTYYQIPNNLHLYVDNPTAKRCLDEVGALYEEQQQFANKAPLTTFPMVANPSSWFTELEFFMRTEEVDPFFQNPFFESVAHPLMCAHKAFKSITVKDLDTARARHYLAASMVNECHDQLLRHACMDWLDRRLEAAEIKYG